MNCGVCGYDYHRKTRQATPPTIHPAHTDAELAETKQAVDLAARVLTAFVLIDMARRVVAA